MNSIEHLWDHLNGKMAEMKDPRVKELKTTLQEEWDRIPNSVLESLVSSMPRCLQTVIKAKGGSTKY